MSNPSLPSDTDIEGKPPGWWYWWDRAATPSKSSSPPTEGEEEGDVIGHDDQDEDSNARWTWLEAEEAAEEAAATRKEARAQTRAQAEALTQIWQRASNFDLWRRTRVLFSSRGGACAHLRRLSAVSIIRHDGGDPQRLSRYFQQVLYAIGEFRGEMIKPASMNTPTKIKNSYMWFPYFRVPRSMSAIFRGMKHYTSQNVLEAVDFDMRFTYVLAGWEGSAHDASILAGSLSRPDGLQIPNGWGEDEFFEEVVTFDEVETGHGVEAGDNDA
ncbi:hypothetical protein QYE76_035039 [Lolium multiflorum]|uniref:DDE Tnp4 domain-containing protein n=1 Tax=Lolium multiflorum TaxID=4521 RepID=A0AAD8R046_LOLMU|nr:hypothetical protein QYE76_035039 [Lolium multiflorum]